MRSMACSVLAGLAVFSGAALAQSPLPASGPLPAQAAPPQNVFALAPAERFRATDMDGDGKVTKAEFKAVLNPTAQMSIERIWANRDTNRDGWLRADEMNSNGASRRGLPQRPAAPAAQPE